MTSSRTFTHQPESSAVFLSSTWLLLCSLKYKTMAITTATPPINLSDCLVWFVLQAALSLFERLRRFAASLDFGRAQTFRPFCDHGEKTQTSNPLGFQLNTVWTERQPDSDCSCKPRSDTSPCRNLYFPFLNLFLTLPLQSIQTKREVRIADASTNTKPNYERI